MKDPTIKKISCGAYHFLLLKENGELFVCGSNQNGQIGRPKEISEELKPFLFMKDINS